MKISFSAPLSIFLFSMLLGSCTHKIAADKMPANQLIFGSGGGFTGAVKAYSLLDDGRIMAQSDDGKTYKSVAKVGKDELSQLKADAQKLDKETFNEPGNLYYFIETKGVTEKNQRLTWGSTDKSVPPAVDALYKRLVAFLPKK
jgi:hypothetical protein